MGTVDQVRKEKKVNIFQSIIMKVILLGTAAVMITIFFNVWTIVPLADQYFGELTKDYLFDLACSNGGLLEHILEEDEPQEQMLAEITETFHEVGIENVQSSYAYIVGKDGIMLYHPTQDKIGQPVENSVVTGLVAQIQGGTIPEPNVIEYDFKGVSKYASYYVAGEGEMILIITADEDEVLRYVPILNRKVILGGLFALVISLIVLLISSIMLTAPIKKITKIILKIAELDFTEDPAQARLNRRGDETGAMSRASSRLREELASVVAGIKAQSQQLHQSAGELSTHAADTAENVTQVDKAVQEIADGSTEQAHETQKATENIMMMGNMVEETNAEIEELRNEARTMRTAGEEASQTMQTLDEINQQAIGSIEIIYDQTHTTNESAKKIREATNLITDIAEETNLLSLNASIEAARAGEQGRGFAVVAGQIQKLAEQSNASAKQIEDIINLLIHDSEEAVKTMDSVKMVMTEQSENVNKTTMIFADVQESIAKTIESIRTIVKKMEMLDSARVSVVDVVQNLSGIAQENAASTEETSASVTEVGNIVVEISENAEQLKKIADELEDDMRAFKL